MEIAEFMKKRDRSRGEIIQDILAVASEGKKTRIMQKACLNSVTFQRYFCFLLEGGFMTERDPENGYYELTDKGRDLLKKLKEVDVILSNGKL